MRPYLRPMYGHIYFKPIKRICLIHPLIICNILCWNILGGKKPQALSELIYLKNKYKPDIIFVIETLPITVNSKRILKSLQFHNNIIVDPINNLGGNWVCWNNSIITVQNQVTHARLVELEILYKPYNKIYIIFCTYCPAQNIDKDVSWAYLNNCLHNAQHLLLFLGNFSMKCNSIKINSVGAPHKNNKLKRLPDLLQTHSTVDILCYHKALSWKGLENGKPIYERFDMMAISI